MRWIFIILGVLTLPLPGSAIEIANLSLLYTDAPFLPSEAAAISVLTKLGAVQGNPDGSFRPNRTVNRAEFLKIAFLSNPRIRAASSDADDCFPDVTEDAWFSRFVCLGKRRGALKGYPDGSFHPERPVNYAEALKILGELYSYLGYAAPDEPWYMGYVRQAQVHRTMLPIELPYDRPLTRGQVARLAAAYRAETDGDLELYRLAERDLSAAILAQREEKERKEGNEVRESIQRSVSSSSFSSFSSFSSLPSFAQSQLLLLGDRSAAPIADATFKPLEEDVELRIVKVIAPKKYSSIEQLFIVDASGNEITPLKLDVRDQDDETWIATFDRGKGFMLPKGEETTLFIDAKMKKRGSGGIPEELIEMKQVQFTMGSLVDYDTAILPPIRKNFPKHQTVQAEITEVANIGVRSGPLSEGERQVLAEFVFRGVILEGAELATEHLVFDVESSGVSVSRWRIGLPGNVILRDCNVTTGGHIECLDLPEEYGRISGEGLHLQLYGNVSFDASSQEHSLQISLKSPGRIGEFGAVRWTDGVGHYTWIESEEPVAEGTLWR